LNFSNFLENHDFARVAPEKCEYFHIGLMVFGSSTSFEKQQKNQLELYNRVEFSMKFVIFQTTIFSTIIRKSRKKYQAPPSNIQKIPTISNKNLKA
jgi:hypothetical protein